MPRRSVFLLLVTCLLACVQGGCAMQTATSSRSTLESKLVSDAGAVGDGKTVNTKAIQAAIDHLSASGGGTLVIPKGTFVSAALFFKPGVNLIVEKDGVLKATVAQIDFPLVNTRWEGVEGMHTSAFLNFENMSHVSVGGEGTIDGSADLWPRRAGGRRGGGTSQPGDRTGGGGATTRPFVFQKVGRPRLICFKNCRDVHIADLHLQKQPIWCLHLLYCQDVVVDNVNIRSVLRTPSSDGIDVDSCSNVLISRCDIACFDDDITIKSGKDIDGQRVNRPSENIHIRDCTIGTGDGIAMGSEVTGSVRHVLVENCTFTGTNHCARIKSQPSRGGVVEDIIFRDIKLNNPGEAFDFEMAWNLRLERQPEAQTLTICRNIQLINFTGSARAVGEILGLPGGQITDVKFQNCNIAADHGLRLRDAVDLDESGLNLQVKTGPKFITGAAATSAPVRLPT